MSIPENLKRLLSQPMTKPTYVAPADATHVNIPQVFAIDAELVRKARIARRKKNPIKREKKANNIVAGIVPAPAKLAINDMQNNVNRKLSKALGITYEAPTITEKDFSSNFLNTLDSINVSQLNKRVPDWLERIENGDTIRLPINGQDYVPHYGASRARGIKYRMTNPIGQIETTLGSYSLEATKDNLMVKDIYDWDTSIHPNLNFSKGIPWYGIFREGMNYVGTPDTAPRNERMKVRIKSNLNL